MELRNPNIKGNVVLWEALIKLVFDQVQVEMSFSGFLKIWIAS